MSMIFWIIFEESVALVGKPVALMNKEDKVTAIQFLNDSGAFLSLSQETRSQIILAFPNTPCTAILMSINNLPANATLHLSAFSGYFKKKISYISRAFSLPQNAECMRFLCFYFPIILLITSMVSLMP